MSGLSRAFLLEDAEERGGGQPARWLDVEPSEDALITADELRTRERRKPSDGGKLPHVRLFRVLEAPPAARPVNGLCDSGEARC